MDMFARITILENEVQARVLDAVLNDQGIPHIMRSYYDSAFDGLFKTQKGWGHIEAPEKYKNEILRILADLAQDAEDAPLNNAAPGHSDESEGDSEQCDRTPP